MPFDPVFADVWASASARAVAMSIGLAMTVLLARFLAERLILPRCQEERRRHRRVAIRSIANVLITLALMSVWIDQLQSLLLSLTAVMIALVVATKELIMCLAGAVLRVGGHLFRVGDRIEVRGLHGEVVDHGFLSTTLQELPPSGGGHRGTGRTFVLPNSVFLTDAVRLEATPRRFAPHRFAITLERQPPMRAAMQALRAIAEAATSGDAERAERFHRMVTSRTGCADCGPEPAVHLRTNTIGKTQFDVTIYCLVEEADRIETDITLAFLVETAAMAAADEQSSDLSDTLERLRAKMPSAANAPQGRDTPRIALNPRTATAGRS